jgi:hypothetical protein
MFKRKAVDPNHVYNWVFGVIRQDPNLDPIRDREVRVQLAEDYTQELVAKIERENSGGNPNKTTEILIAWEKGYKGATGRYQ